MHSYLSDRTQLIAYSAQISDVQSVVHGVPQASVHGPLPYVLYTVELRQLVEMTHTVSSGTLNPSIPYHQLAERHGVTMHEYVNDCQLYLNTPVTQQRQSASYLRV